MGILETFRVVQLGPGLAAAACGRLFADLGASVARHGADRTTPLAAWLNHEPDAADIDQAIAGANLIICEGSPATLRRENRDVEALRPRNATAAIVLISPFGQTGPRAEEPATDLTLFFASGIARMLTGQVDDLTEPPMAPAGNQSAFIAGLAAACAGMHAALHGRGGVIDVSIHEALATLAMTELARAGQTGRSWPRKRVDDGNGATVCILPASDGYAAISPREERQWAAWVAAMGTPEWAGDPRFATKKDRVANWDALHALMSAWSRDRSRHEIAAIAQDAHVPSFALCEPSEHLGSPQLAHRRFFRDTTIAGEPARMPGLPFGLALHRCAPMQPPAGALPLSGMRVLDFSWVIAGPTATRYLAAMGAEVIKIEAPGRGDPGRASELHMVLGQAKKSIVLDLKTEAGIAAARGLAETADVLVENFATGVMDRLGLSAEALRAINPQLIYVSASGVGRTGPDAQAVAYGTLLQCYTGFAGLNRHAGIPPRVGMAWLDPMCGLMLAFITAAAIWRRRSGLVARVDFSMIEAMLWTMAEPLLAGQGHPAPPLTGAVYRCAGDDEWLAVDPRQPRSPVARGADAASLAAAFVRDGVAAAALARSADLVTCPHLGARGFWDRHGAGVLPGLPWRASFGRATGPAPALGADTDAVLTAAGAMMS